MDELYDLAQDPHELKKTTDDEQIKGVLTEMQVELARLLELTS